MLVSIIVVIGFIAFMSTKFENNKSTTLYIFSPNNPISQEQLNGLNIDVISLNPSVDTFKITSYPTYVLVKTKTQELLLITNNFADIVDLRKKKNI